MRYAQLRKMDISNGEGIGVALFVQGCEIHCSECFNPETWDFNGGEEFTMETYYQLLNLLDKPHIQRFSILGGEALAPQNIDTVIKLVYLLKKHKPNLKIWVWTGYDWNQIKNQDRLFQRIDYLICGPFIKEQKDLSLLWRGSRNQEVIDIQATLLKGEKVLYVE